MKLIEKRSGYFTSFDNTKIYYEMRGEGEPIVLVYGIGCLMNHWQQQISHFSVNYKVISFDFRGHHKSEIPSEYNNVSIESLARDIQLLLNLLKIKKTSFWGHSFGAQVILKLYQLDPDLFSNIIFINGFASNPFENYFNPESALPFLKNLIKGLNKHKEVSKHLWSLSINNPLSIFLSSWAGGFNLNLTHLKDIEIYVRGVSSIEADVFFTLFEDLIQFDGRHTLNEISVPTMIISGKKDTITPMKHQKLMHEQIRGSEWVEIPYGSHCTQLDFPDYVNLKIEKFLERISNK